MEHKGRMSKPEEKRIDARANRELGKGKKREANPGHFQHEDPAMKHGMKHHPGEHSAGKAHREHQEHVKTHLKDGVAHLEAHHKEERREIVREPHRERGHHKG